MSDITAPIEAPAPEAPAPEAPAPGAPATVTLSADELQAMLNSAAAQAVAHLPQPAASPAAPAAKPAKPAFAEGSVVCHTHEGPEGPISRYGVVLAALHDEGAADRNVVAWYAGVSGPIAAGDLEQA